MTSLPPYKARKSDPVSVPLNEPIEFSAIDWYECDLTVDTPIEKKDSYLNQDHNKTYTIFIFGCNSKGQSICLRVRNYLPYFYVQIPDDFNDKQVQDFVDNFSSSKCEDYDEDELAEYEEAQEFKNYKFTEEFKRGARYYKDSIVEAVAERGQGSDNSMLYRIGIEDKKVLKTQLVEKKIFWSFMNEQKFTFLKLAHKSKTGHRFMERAFKNPMKLKIKDKVSKEIKYNLFESDLEPILRFLHDTKIKPSSWIRIEAGKFKVESRQSKTQINISCDWADINHLDKTEIPPILIASFDIEADSSHGDFPIPKKDCKKLSSQLVVAWIRDMRNVEKKGYEKVPGFVVGKSGLPIELHYIDKKNEDYDSEMMAKCKAALEGSSVPSQKEITYLREVIKYIKSKQNLSKKKDFFIHRIKQALGAEQFASLDDDIDLIYLKKPIKAKVFTNSSDFAVFIDKIYTICNRPIRKVKANNEMKKAVKEVTAIESAKTKTNPRFTIDDLVKIINDVAKKNKIPERDLQDKIITKETMVRFINILLNRSFGHAEGDKVIQIGTVFWRYGEPEICHNNIITLKGCSAFKVGDKNCEVISKNMERDVLLEWSKLIELHDPDIIIGYNTFGFDESFMYDRIADLCIDVERATLTKEDIKALEQNTQYNKFINMGRLDDNIIKKVPDAKGAMINKKLSSSALGDNFLYYFNMPGRVQIDLLKVCQASLTKLPSYKLDSVAEFYISGKIKEIGYAGEKLVSSSGSGGEMSGMGGLGGAGPDASCYLKVDNIVELEVGNYIVISMSATTAKLFDGEKLKILEIDRDAKKIKVDRAVPKSCLGSGPVWGMGKDDITPQDIFRMQKGTDAERAEVAKYCIQDCVLLIRLLRKLEVVPNNFGMSNVCLVPFAYIFLRGQGIKAFSLVTNECAKEDFLLPVLEKIEPEEEVVDDNVRRVHTVIAGASGGGDVEDIESGDLDGALAEAGDLDLGADGSDGEDGGEGGDSGGEEDSVSDEKGKSKVKFTLKPNFNQIIMNDESYEGAIVLKPKTDIYTEDPIVVLDFSSLYPSEMITSDLSHDRICEDPYWLGETGAKHLADLGLSYLDRSYDNFEWINPKIKSKGKRKCGTSTIRFVQYPDGRKGLIPRVLQSLLKSRKTSKKLMEAETDPFKKSLYDGLQLAYKVTANSIYGAIGSRTSKIFKPQIAASTTAGGRARIIHARDFILREYPGSWAAYGDTDSVFMGFLLYEKNEKISDREKIARAISIGQEVERRIKAELPGVHALAYEKTLFPFILISKKRYLALKYEDSPDSCKQISMGLVLKRRDNAPILKHCYLGVIDNIVKNKNVPNAIKFVQDEIKKMIDEKFDMNMFVISKTLSSFYKDEEAIAHKVLANRMYDRDPGTAPASNERVPYIFIKIKEETGVDYLNGDRIEHVDYVRKHNLQIDYEKYIESQLVKPISQIFELIVEKLPMFPYGKGYYEEMYNIWYNKYNGDIEKTEKKIKQLKSIMVKKLIFQPLIDYANSKVNKVATIDNWFKAEELSETEVKEEVKKGEKPKHEIKVKKTKQMSLDSFF
jgi:DNA polymerase elongation subunit (family B)